MAKRKPRERTVYWIAESNYADGDWSAMNLPPKTSKRKAKDAIPPSALIGRTTRVVRFVRSE